MKLTDEVKKILSSVQYFGDVSSHAIAKKLGLKESTVRRVISTSFTQGILKRRVYINSYALGLSQYSIFFNSSNRSAAHKLALRNLLIASPCVELVLEVGGQFDFGIVVTAASAFEVEKFLEHLTSKKGGAISGIRIHTRTGWYYFGAKYLYLPPYRPTIKISPSGPVCRLSSEDLSILDAFCKSDDGNRSTISRKLGIPLSTLQYRLSQLEKTGIIAGVRYQILAERIRHESFRVLVAASAPSQSLRVALHEWAQKHRSVLTFMHGIGNWDYELRIEADEIVAAKSTVDEMHDRFSGVLGATELIPISGVLKMALTPDFRALPTS